MIVQLVGRDCVMFQYFSSMSEPLLVFGEELDGNDCRDPVCDAGSMPPFCTGLSSLQVQQLYSSRANLHTFANTTTNAKYIR